MKLIKVLSISELANLLVADIRSGSVSPSDVSSTDEEEKLALYHAPAHVFVEHAKNTRKRESI